MQIGVELLRIFAQGFSGPLYYTTSLARLELVLITGGEGVVRGMAGTK